MNPKIKLIVIIREPVERTVSTYTHIFGSRLKLKSYTKHFNSQVFYKNGSVLIDNDSSKFKRKGVTLINDSLYAIHLKNWLKYFPLEQILFINGHEFVRNPYDEVKKVETFLELTPYFKREHFIFDTKKKFFCINPVLFNSTDDNCLGKSKGRKHIQINAELLGKLKIFYKPYSIELFKIIKQKPFWEI